MNQDAGLQTPFLQPDLLTVSSFVSYCRDHGVVTDKDELEYFAKEGLLIPAVRVLMGVVKYRHVLLEGNTEWSHVFEDQLSEHKYTQIEPTTYYDRGALVRMVPGLGSVRGFHFGNDGWMDWYSERDMVRYPAVEGYIPWTTFDGGPSFSEDLTLFDEVSELMYAKHQIYLLKYIQNRRTLSVKNAGLFKTPEAWAKSGQMITKIFSEADSNESIREYVIKLNRFFDTWTKIRKLRHAKLKLVSDAYQKALVDYEGDQNFALHVAQDNGQEYDETIQPEARRILDEADYTITDLEDWRYTILGHGSFGTGSQSSRFRGYVTKLDDALLNKTEDAYQIVNELSWFIEVLGGEAATAKQLILRSMNYHCKYCGKAFVPTRRTQVYTCGDAECRKQQQLDRKREGRKIGKYK